MSAEVDEREHDHSLQTRKQRIRQRHESLWWEQIMENEIAKTKKLRKISLKKGSKLVSKCMNKTFPNLPTKIENERKNSYECVPGINPVQIDHYDFNSDILNISVLDNYQRKIVYETMQILKKNKEMNTLGENGHYFGDIHKIVKRCDKNQHKQMARRDL